MNNGDNRELILANFQAITGIEDISICLATLDQFNWDIDTAVVAAVSDNPTSPTRPLINDSRTPNLTSFKVDWKGREEHLTLDTASTTIGTLKEMLSNRVGIPKNKFTIIGFPTLEVQTEHRTLQQMGVTHGTSLIMVEADNPLHTAPLSHPGQSTSSNHYTFKFKMLIEGRENDLVFPADNLVSDVKRYIESSHRIPLSHQKWEGWPPGTSDILELKDLVLNTPFHRLSVTHKPPVVEIDSDDEFLIDDDMVTPTSSSSQPSQQPLMTVGKSAEENVIQFLEVFESRYGHVHPAFHIGTLKSAMAAAFNVPADNKRPLIVFLHSDKALTAHLFCSQVICCENISQYIDQNFVLWAHDMTHRRLQQLILADCQSIFGLEGRRQVETYVPEKLPLMIVITKVQSSPQVFSVFEGDISPDMLMAQLVDAVENYTQTRSIEKAAEVEQEQRNMLRALQEQEYHDSLERDRQKEEIKKIEEKEKILQQATENAKLSSFIDLIPDEPDPGLPSADVTFKLPSGERINRRFLHSTKLRCLSYYIGSKGFPPQEFKLVQNFPKRRFDEDEMELTLEELGITRREILYVEEMD